MLVFFLQKYTTKIANDKWHFTYVNFVYIFTVTISHFVSVYEFTWNCIRNYKLRTLLSEWHFPVTLWISWTILKTKYCRNKKKVECKQLTILITIWINDNRSCAVVGLFRRSECRCTVSVVASELCVVAYTMPEEQWAYPVNCVFLSATYGSLF